MSAQSDTVAPESPLPGAGPRVNYPRDASIPELFERVARDHAGATALIQGERSLTYGALETRANAVARALHESGLGEGGVVAVAVPRSPETIVAFLGVLKAGAAYMPLDLGHPGARLSMLIRSSGASIAVADPADRNRLVAEGLPIPIVGLPPPGSKAATPPEANPGAESLAYVMFTSGSTGIPKGVEVPHRAVVREALGSGYLEFGPEDVVLGANPLVFDGSVHEIYGALLQGSTLVLAPPGVPSPETMRRLAREHGATILMAPTAVFRELVDAGLAGYETVRQAYVGGDVMPPDSARVFLEALPTCRLFNVYGPAETTCDACAHELTDAAAVGERVPIGRPLGNTRAYVLDDAMRPVPHGAEGELYLGGDGLADGYRGRPDLTAERFLADPFAPDGDGRLYRTGDRARTLPDGSLDFLGRRDGQVKIRGFRIEAAEVEAALLSHPDVAGAVVVAREGAGGTRTLAGYVVSENGSIPTGELRDHMAALLPPYMVPADLVTVERLPLTPSGKIDRAALPAPDRPGAGRGPKPRSKLEERLAGIWAELLDVDRVARVDDFLALGGDSLTAMRIVARIAASEGVEVPPETVLKRPTIAALAAAVEENRASAGAGALPPIVRERQRFAPTSFAQERTWFLQRLEPTSRAYQFQDILWLEGELDATSLRRALDKLVRRHEILRTTFHWGNGGPIQVVHPPWRTRVPLVDLTELPVEEREPAVRERVSEEVGRSFDVTQLPLARWVIYRVDERRHALLHIEHHLVHDGWSWALFRRELAQLYGAFARGRKAPFSRPAIQFADFARWQREVVAGDFIAPQIGYWTKRLTPPPPPLELPADRPRPTRRTFSGGRVHADLPADVAARLDAAASTTGATPFVLMLTAFYALLHALTGEDDICVGTGVANRRRPEAETVLGMAINSVALRADAGGDPTGLELLDRVRTEVLGALANQDAPLDEVVRAVSPPRRPGRMPLYDVLFSFDDSPGVPTHAGELRIHADEGVPNATAKADLNVVVVHHREGAGRYRVLWEFSTELFEEATGARLLDAYRALLDAFLDAPERRLTELEDAARPHRGEPPHLAPSSGSYERDATIAELFAARARERPDAVALEQGSATMTYGELDLASSRLAHRLRARDIGHEDLVGIFAERSPELIVALLGVLKAGAAYLPLEPDYPEARLDFMLADADARVVLAQPGLASRLPDSDADVIRLEPGLAWRGGGPETAPVSDAGPESLAYVIYTSGSTGRPKGVEALQRGVIRLVRGTDYAEFGPGETFLALAPIAFDASTFEIWGALLNGARLVIAPPGMPSLTQLGDVIQGHGVTTLWLSAGLFHEMVDANPAGLAALHQLLAGGDVLSPAHVRRALEANPDLSLINGYGPTETTTFACCHPIADPAEVTGPVPIGPPIAHTTVRVLDERRRDVEDGTTGELYIGGDGLARGYRNRPELTAERFIPDPYEPGERLYRTGDLVRRRPDGVLEFLGRVDDQVKVRGFRVEPGEIETVLSEHPDIGAAAVVPQRDGAAKRRLVAFVVPAAETQPPDPLAWLSERLPGHMIPAACVTLPALPLTPNGKVDRAALAGRPVVARAAPDDRAEPPATDTERRLAEIWVRLLKAGEVAREDNFFDLGGHSLLTLRLLAEIEAEFRRELPVATVFEAPTLAALAERIEAEGVEIAWRSLVPIAPGGGKRPFFCVPGAGGNVALFGELGHAFDPDRPFYGLQARGLDGRTEPHRRLEEMASAYLREIRMVQPHGPYLIGGMCRGAQVALEMAQQLQATGGEVALLCVLDSKQPKLDAARARERRRERRRAHPAPLPERMARAARRRARIAGRLLRRARLRSWRERRDAATRFLRPQQRAAAQRVKRANSRAMRSYVARPYAGRIALLESEHSAKQETRTSRAGWEQVAREGLDYEVVPGSHRSMLRRPHVHTLAGVLAARLDAADDR